MANVSIRIPDDIKKKMKEHDEINWSAVLREKIREEIENLNNRNLAHAVATSERLSQKINKKEVENQDTAKAIRNWREKRYGSEK